MPTVFTQQTIDAALQGFQVNPGTNSQVSLLFLSWLYFYVHGLCGHSSKSEIFNYLRSAPWETRSEFQLPRRFADYEVMGLLAEELSDHCSLAEAWIGLMDMWRFHVVQLFLHFDVIVPENDGVPAAPQIVWTEETFPPALIEQLIWGPLEWFPNRQNEIFELCHASCQIIAPFDNYILFGVASLIVCSSESNNHALDSDIFRLKLHDSAQLSRQHLCTLVWTKMHCTPPARKTRNVRAGDTFYAHSSPANVSRNGCSSYEQGLLHVSKLRFISRAVDPANFPQYCLSFSCGLSPEFLLPYDLSRAAPLPETHDGCEECVYADASRNNKAVHYFCAKMHIANRRRPVSGPCGKPVYIYAVDAVADDNLEQDHSAFDMDAARSVALHETATTQSVTAYDTDTMQSVALHDMTITQSVSADDTATAQSVTDTNTTQIMAIHGIAAAQSVTADDTNAQALHETATTQSVALHGTATTQSVTTANDTATTQSVTADATATTQSATADDTATTQSANADDTAAQSVALHDVATTQSVSLHDVATTQSVSLHDVATTQSVTVGTTQSATADDTATAQRATLHDATTQILIAHDMATHGIGGPITDSCNQF